ncbi:KxYKxGKxW signal peptide domain-containing protein, partial [Lacticaseibacillus zhaodongensis]|uniref:KxYKxGKxW signal peptide domain-containing protein n=1 Tax=Lacticaseibacillus zhaodongensis TaxID=2668065 RepID=UPI0012D3316F
MQRNRDVKLHFKMYKDGKRWMVAGLFVVAMSGVAIAPAVLSPMVPVNASSSDSNYSNSNANYKNFQDTVKNAIASGNFVDETKDGSSSVHFDESELQAIVQGHLKLIVKDDSWTIVPTTGYQKASLGDALKGYPTEQLKDPTNPANAAIILDYLKSHGPITNGGNTTGKYMTAPIISTDGFEIGNSNQTGGLAQTGTNIVEGNLVAGTNTNNFGGGVLITGNGAVSGQGALPSQIPAAISDKKLQFSSDSVKTQAEQLSTAAAQIADTLTKSDASTKLAPQNGGFSIDTSKAKKDSQGNYVYTIDSSALQGGNPWLNISNPDGGKVIINITGGGTVNLGSANLKGTGAVITSTDGTTLDLTNADQGGFTVLAPDSTVIGFQNNFSGAVKVLNGLGTDAPNLDTGSTPAAPKVEHLTATITNHVVYADSDTKDTAVKLPANYDRTMTVNYDKTTGTDGKVSYSNVKIDKDFDALNAPALKGYTSKVAGDVDSGALLKQLQTDPSKPLGDTTTTVTYTAAKPVTVHKTTTVKQVVNFAYADGADGDASKLPAPVTRDVTVDYDETTAPDGTVTKSNFAPQGGLDAITPAEIAGYITNDSNVANTAEDEKAIVAKASEDGDNGVIQSTIIYFPSSTSVHKSITATNHVEYELSDGDDGDASVLPADYDRTITITYTEVTDSAGNKTKTNFSVDSDFGAVQAPHIDGYTVDTTGDITADAIIAQLKASPDGTALDTYTDVEYEKVEVGAPQADKAESGDAVSVSRDDFYDKTGITSELGAPQSSKTISESGDAVSVSRGDFYDKTGITSELGAPQSSKTISESG